MKLRIVSLILAGALTSSAAYAIDPTIMIGLSYDFGANPKDNIGLTAKIISTRQPDRFIAGVGGSYFPFGSQQFGIDVSGGYVTNQAAFTAGYDFLRWTPQISAGWAPTKK